MEDERMAIVDCQMGKTESYRYIVEKYQSRAFYAALLYTGNRDDALDLSQEAFYRAFRAIKSFQTGKNFYTWFYKILKNLCINYYKRTKSRRIVFSDIEQKTK
jgi:RNA polymerase sigma-70 factor (ECF subfamily)